ncbi:TRAP transporter substrate-binding protein DctP [Hoeflea sp. TYP-13]|uniref:TRAP transporter substrate-binding protein DctP n=1 Tax=Hoeflea sp. TYP-13 TaxID=3230023 RepID=UPI0034C6353E
MTTLTRQLQSISLCTIGAALGISLGVSGTAFAADHNWTLAYLPVKGTIYYDIAVAIPDRIKEATDGRLEITANGSLVKGNRLLEGVRDGLVEMSVPLTGYYTGTQPLFTVSALPGISESLSDFQKLYSSPYGDMLRELYADTYNSKELMSGAFCPQTLFSTKPIQSKQEWEGKRLRVNNRGTGLVGDKLGALTVSLSAGEVLPALERGVIDGVMTDTCWAHGAGFYTVVEHASDWRLGSVVGFPVLVNRDAWSELPEDLRVVVEAEFREIEADFFRRWEELVAQMPSRWEAEGVEYHRVSDEEMTKVYDPEILKPVFENWYADARNAGLDPEHIEQVARDAVK